MTASRARTKTRPWRTWRLAGIGALAAVALALAFTAPSRVSAQPNLLAPVQTLIAGLDFDEARAMLDGATAAAPDDPRIALERARLAIYELDCDGAAAILARPEVQALDRDQLLGDIARGCQRVTASLVGQRDDQRAIDVRWQDEHDAPLAPLLMDTIAAARDALTRDLGVDWPRPTRVVVVRDLLSLAAMTGLPYESARTTGTVAVAKWGRVTLLSPRASRYGFPWRDTVAHELTHLAVTRATGDRAPLWLQEGVAKREETRWRPLGPFDDRPSPEVVALHGIERGLGLPLDRLGPSIAMLPSADAAMVAFAEVTSFVRFYASTASDGATALPVLFRELKAGRDPNAALVAASGADLKTWDARWRAGLEGRAAAATAAGQGEPVPDPAALGRNAARSLRDRTRLAELLLLRGHAEDAVKELDRIDEAASAAASTDPMVRSLRGHALEAAGRASESEELVSDPKSVAAGFGPWWALRGRLARGRGDDARADTSFAEAITTAPFDPEAACETQDPTALPAAAGNGSTSSTPSAPSGAGGPGIGRGAGGATTQGTSASTRGDGEREGMQSAARKNALCEAARAYALPPLEGE
jgi:hypothetical protein